MNLMFWKKKPVNESEIENVPGMLARIRARVAALTGRIKSPPPFKAEVVEDAEALSVQAAPAGAEESLSLEYASSQRGKLARIGIALVSMIRARMLIFGVVLLLLLLLAVGYAAWSIIRSSPDQKADVTELIEDKHPPLPIVMPASAPAAASDVFAASAASAASAPAGTDAASAVTESHEEKSVSSVPVALPASVIAPLSPASHVPQTEVEMLRQKNIELQAQLDALKKAQQSSSASVKLYSGDRRGAPAGGVATVGNSDPKAAVTTLKEAIEAMNSGSNYQKKPAK